MNENEYQGWSNWATWNVALYIQNEEPLYRLAKSLRHKANPYGEFRYIMTEEVEVTRTADGVSYNDPSINAAELNEMIREL